MIFEIKSFTHFLLLKCLLLLNEDINIFYVYLFVSHVLNFLNKKLEILCSLPYGFRNFASMKSENLEAMGMRN